MIEPTHSQPASEIERLRQQLAESERQLDALRAFQQGLEQRVEARTAELLRANQRLSQEVAERKRAEEESRQGEALLRLLMDSVPAYISYIDSQLRYRWVSHGYEVFFGLPREQMVGQRVREVLGEVMFRAVEPRLRRALAGETVKYQATFTDHAGAAHDQDVTYIPHFMDQSVAGCFVLVFDIGELRKAEERVRQLQADLAHAGRLNTMGEMASGLAHEVNQPLAAIASYAEGGLLRCRQGQISQAALVDLLERITEQTGRAGSIIRRLRAFVARTPPTRALLALNDIVLESLRLIDGELRTSALQLRLELPEPSPLVFVDRIQLVQVFVNLASNAIEAMGATPAEQRELTIRTSSERPLSRVQVADTGCGLAAEITARLFQPFRTTKPKGMGMGLAISRSIIESHGGSIRAEPRAGGGTVFEFTLPAPPIS